jgi:MinD-like ATPase involved in chromosome partitioning or flagellar assembly
MLIICRSVKGGAGTSVVAAALASISSRTSSTLLVDLAGDQPAIFGSVTPVAGLADWLQSPHSDSLVATAIDIDDDLRILPTGDTSLPHPESSAWTELTRHLVERSRADVNVVVDIGCHSAPPALVEVADRVVLVVRPCYLTLRRAVTLGNLADSVVVVDEEHRALRPRDVESVLGLPVVAVVKSHPMVSRRVDAGILHGRLPDSLANPLRELLAEPSRSAS